MRFRRHSSRRRFRRPTFWVRSCFQNSALVAAAHTSAGCDDWPVISIDELAPGNPEFGGEDRKYTVRRVRVVGQIDWSVSGISSVRGFTLVCVVVQCDIALIGPLIGPPSGVQLGNVLLGGSVQAPSAMDVLQIHTWGFNTGQGISDSLSNGSIVSGSFNHHADIDVQVARRLESSECIAALWFLDENEAGRALPSASSFQASWTMIKSALYSESPKR